MAIQRAILTQQVPVRRAQLVDPSAFRFGTAGAEALKIIGGVLEELGEHKVEMQDRISVSSINAAMENAEREYQKEILAKPIEEHAVILQKHKNKAIAFALRQRLSPETRELVEGRVEAWGDFFADKGEIVTLKAMERDAIIRVTADYEKALTEGTEEDIAEARTAILAQYAISYTPAEATVMLAEVEQRAEEQIIENAKQAQMERAVINPNQVIAAIDEELKKRTKDKKPSPEFALLSNTDLDDIRGYANSILTQAKIGTKQKDDAIGGEFLNLLINKLDPSKPQLTFDMIAASDLSFDAKVRWESRLRVFDNYSEEELKEAFVDNGAVLADIYDKIDKGTLTDELDTMVGKGLSPTTAQRIKKEIREPYEKDTEQLFKRIFGWSPELGFENDFSSFLYEKSLREWQAEVKRQDATGEKITEIGRSVVRPYFLEHLRTVMPSDTNISRMLELALGEEIKPPLEVIEKPPEPPAEPITPKITPIVKPKRIADRKARIRSWVVPFNLKHKTRLQPSVLDAMSDEFIDRLASLTPSEREEVLKKIEAGEIIEPESPKTYIEFEAEVARLKKEDMKKAKKYYDKWIGNFTD